MKRHLFSNLITHPKFISDTKSAIGLLPSSFGDDLLLLLLFLDRLTPTLHCICFLFPADAYTHTDSELLKSENSHTRDAGSTASTAILVGDRLLVANVGDSRAVICRSGSGNFIEISDNS